MLKVAVSLSALVVGSKPMLIVSVGVLTLRVEPVPWAVTPLMLPVMSVPLLDVPLVRLLANEPSSVITSIFTRPACPDRRIEDQIGAGRVGRRHAGRVGRSRHRGGDLVPPWSPRRRRRPCFQAG